MHELLRAAGLHRARSLDEACRVVERSRRRPLRVTDAALGPGLFGMWLGFVDHDRIVVNSQQSLSAHHRRHIIAHELMHVLEAVAAPEHERDEARRDGYDDPTERRVEQMASELMISIASLGSSGDRLMAAEMYR
ncbi:hypothetical protein [Oerskovia turbata]